MPSTDVPELYLVDCETPQSELAGSMRTVAGWHKTLEEAKMALAMHSAQCHFTHRIYTTKEPETSAT